MFLESLRHGRGAAGDVLPVGTNGLFHVRNLFVHVYACRTSKGILLFDTGLDPLGRPLDQLLDRLRAVREDVSDVFLTHGHPDHVAGAPLFDSATVHAGAGDWDRFQGSEPGKKPAERLFRLLFRTPQVKVDRPLRGVTEIECGDRKPVMAFPLPGETPGAFAFLARKSLMVGDSLELRHGRLQPAPRYAADDPERNLRSIVELAKALSGAELDFVCTAHGGPTPRGQASRLLADVAERASQRLRSGS
jgi:glyoxylase-like metal-dependent hydrolase (beta-lactamase superfamily II)